MQGARLPGEAVRRPRGAVRRPAPLLGEHTDEVLARGRPPGRARGARAASGGDERRSAATSADGGGRAGSPSTGPQARNAMTFGDVRGSCTRAASGRRRPATIRVVVLRGAGGKAFVAGTDIAPVPRLQHRRGRPRLRGQRSTRVVDRLERVAKPTVAVVDGWAVGGGLGTRRRLRPAHRHAGREVRRADRAHARQLPVDGELRPARRAVGDGAAQAAACSRRARC